MRLITLLREKKDFIDLVGRRPTIPVKEYVIELIAEAPSGTIFYYDMSEVREVNGSGIHEVIIKPMEWLYENYKTHNKFLVLKNLSEEFDHFYNILLTCNEEKASVITESNGNHIPIGARVGDALREVLGIVYERKMVSAREISDILEKKHTLISTHLTKLYEMRLVNRQEDPLLEGGRQFTYSSLF
ncbi:ArsR family transcriptional regulator [Paenibacillus oleatilyticus]|uniref:ArsR family transcriptional regulator n=1 Tax=Paenibacillus oleatilyticus TaxID=2594886 RepID=UPI001C1FAFED|nr:ArsR family transcriptional regulator [Paenibacillus oleatilyticus]MBU7318215.1 ArsR family transcriptional regulator [Paenibacillus oleatilyticus]